MRIGPLTIDRRFLESRVARRMFVVIATCALLPVALFALFSYRQVRDQVEGGAALLLRSESKAAGMAIMERLLLAEDTMRLISASATPGALDAPLRGSASRVFRSLRVAPEQGPYLMGLSRRESAHLARGNTLLALERVDGEGPSILLLQLRDPDDPAQGAWIALLDREYLFTAARRATFDRYWVVDSQGSPLFWAPHDSPPHRSLSRDDRDRVTLAEKIDIEGETWLTANWELFVGAAFGADSWSVGVARPLEEIHRPLHDFEASFPWIAGIALCVALGMTLVQVRRSLVPIAALATGAERIAGGDLRARVAIESSDEFGDLSRSFNKMAQVIGYQVDVLSTVNSIGAALSAEFDPEQLLELILVGSMEVTRADAGGLFLLARLPRAAAARCVAAGDVVRVRDLSQVDGEERRAWLAFGRQLDHPVRGYVAVPLQQEGSEVGGVLLLMRYRDEHFSDEACSLAVSLASQAAVSIQKNRLVDSFRSLFEGLIQLTAKAIDEKSPYTGDHCRKVPIITELIADAACATTVGPLKDFSMTEEERYELRIAALLHDCGKVVTPVHVMDKATKLETIFDRIQLVEARFEVLRRDAVIRALARRIRDVDVANLAESDADLARDFEEIDDDLAFLRTCNVGGEHMPVSHQKRVREIAERHRWSPVGSRERAVLEAEELENLTISRGTLNASEREIINQHVVTTISLLEELPFPRDMRNVPAIAGAHHEHVNGSGYPLRLRGEQLSVQSRILGLADVFEALTAKDRPYKPGRTLSETLEIIQTMCSDGHVDAGLFELLVDEKIHLRYAVAHLGPEQIDSAHRETLEQLTEPWGQA